MKKLSFGALALLFASLCFFTACKDEHEHDETDLDAPVLTLEKPAEGASVSGEVHIHGKVTDASLHELEIKLTKDADGSELLKAKPTVHDKKEYSFDEHFTPVFADETSVTLTITVEDHSSNKTVKTVKFKVKQ